MIITLMDGLVFEVDRIHCTPVQEKAFILRAEGEITIDGREMNGWLIFGASTYGNLKIESPSGETEVLRELCSN